MSGPLLIGRAFGTRDFPRILSYNQLVMNFGVALGPILIGAIYDFGGGHQNAFLAVSTQVYRFFALARSWLTDACMKQMSDAHAVK